MNGFSDKVSLIWDIANLLRGPYKPPQYGDVILPLTVLRRLDCVLEPTKAAVLAKASDVEGKDEKTRDRLLKRAAKLDFYNTSKLDFQRIKDDPDHVSKNLVTYMKRFSPNAREILEYFGFEKHIEKLDQHGRLYLVVKKFAETDLHPDTVPNYQMGLVFEELIRKFKELSNEEAGDHFTPREVIRLMVNLLLTPDTDVLRKKGIIKTVYDPACGTGGMLSVTEEYVRELNPDAKVVLFGQEYNDESYAICGSDMLIKGQSLENLIFGDTFLNDGLKGETFDYMLANPPFGVEWKPQQAAIKKEHEDLGFGGRFGAGLPRINDGSLLFLQHMISKMKPAEEGGSRIAIVFNASPLFAGDAGQGESEIRKWIIENDWLEAIIALPDQLFYNTGIFTYVWIVTNRKSTRRKGKVQLINATALFHKLRKSLGQKRHEVVPAHIAAVTELYGNFLETPDSKIFKNRDFAYRQITIERPLRLAFQITAERLAMLANDASAAARSVDTGAVSAALSAADQDKIFISRDEFETYAESLLSKREIKFSAALRKLLITTFGQRDPVALPLMNAKGETEPDSALRDTENVPIDEDVAEYVRREVLPYVADAWVNEEKDAIGYEIPVSRHFYIYKSQSSAAELASELAPLVERVSAMLSRISNGLSE